MEHTVQEETTILEVLRQLFHGASTTTLRTKLKTDQVVVNGRVIRRADQAVHSGQTVVIRSPGKNPGLEPPFPLLFEDDAILVAVKPTGLLSMSTGHQRTDTICDLINQFLQLRRPRRERAFVVHRLDRGASGVMIFAKSPAIKQALQNRWTETEKRYYALAEGHPPKEQDTLSGWLYEDASLMVRSGPKRPGAQYAVTHYKVLQRYERHTLLEVKIDTGRKNQIRVHLADLGCPIAGDTKYGAQSDPLKRLGLHAFFLALPHPVTGESMQWETPLPGEFASFDRRQKANPPHPS